MPIIFYYDLLSQPCRAVYMFLKLTGVPFEAKHVGVLKETRGNEFKKINPLSVVPVIDDDGFILTESIAIVKYVIKKHGLADHWFPQNDLKKQARVEEYLHWQHSNTRRNSASLFQNLLLIPRARGTPVNQENVEIYREKVKTMVFQLETYYLKDRHYLAGNEISIADIFGVCELMQLYACHENGVYESSPVVGAWVERIRKETNPHYDEAHKIVYRTHDVYHSVAAKL